MPYKEYDQYSDPDVFLDESGQNIDPRDTYGSRFSVVSRKITSTSKSAFSKGVSRFRNFDKRITNNDVDQDRQIGTRSKNISPDNPYLQKNDADINKQNTDNNTDNSDNDDNSILSDFRSAGLDSLFESTIDKLPSKSKSAVSGPANDAQDHNLDRKVTVLKPISYNAVKDVCDALKGGNVLVLCLKNTNREAANRVLDFTFGAASMCGAMVSVAAEKTYVVTSGPGLSQREKLLCIKQGVTIKNL